MEFLTIYILCHNRPDYARQAISSVLSQTCRTFTLIVSDNSSNDNVELMVRNKFPNVRYIRRLPMLEPLEHFNYCIDEVRSEYFCLFHDDDVMSPHFVDVMLKNMYEHPAAIAFGCNAVMEKFDKPEPRTCFRSFRKHELITTPRNLARRYFSRAQSGFAPFPGYVYNRRLVGEQRLPIKGGKYADVAWLLSIVQMGTIVWVNKPLMTYRLHEGNDGNIESLRDRLRLLGYLKQNQKIFGAGLLQDYRCGFIYKKIVSSLAGTHPERHRVVVAFLNNYRWSRYTKFDYYKALAVRVLVKWVAER
jgi:glycosyltransferase involved in cell wall biosynthesis